MSTDTKKSWLKPRWAPGEFALAQDDPFAELREEPLLRLGSFGLYIDLQLDSLEKIGQAKTFSKAVKADDADVPSYLWNDRIRAPGVEDGRRDWALDILRKVHQRRFLKCLVQDCIQYMHEKDNGSIWGKARRTRDGELTQLGKDCAAILGILWHSFHTSWFEYHADSHLIHSQFPPRHWEMARDGMPVYFERPGPTTQDAQPSVSNPRLLEMAKLKILKVVKRRYLHTSDVNLKSLIKYFAVPKGEEDIRLVYDAMANRLNELGANLLAAHQRHACEGFGQRLLDD